MPQINGPSSVLFAQVWPARNKVPRRNVREVGALHALGFLEGFPLRSLVVQFSVRHVCMYVCVCVCVCTRVAGVDSAIGLLPQYTSPSTTSLSLNVCKKGLKMPEHPGIVAESLAQHGGTESP